MNRSRTAERENASIAPISEPPPAGASAPFSEHTGGAQQVAGAECAPADLDHGDHFTSELGIVLLATLRERGGEAAVEQAIRESGTRKDRAELEAGQSWLSFNEAIGLLEAGARICADPHFARHVGEGAIPMLKGSPLPQMLRDLGSLEEVYRQITATSGKMNRVAYSEARAVGPGYAEIVIRARPGFPRARQHCEWTRGLLTQPPIAYGLPPAIVEHEQCAAQGAPCCVYRVLWQSESRGGAGNRQGEIEALREQVRAMSMRLDNLFAAAADLIESDDIDLTLARIVDRAVHELRNPRCLLVVRTHAGEQARVQQRGLTAQEVAEALARVERDANDPPPYWVLAPVRSRRRDYGVLVAIYEHEGLIYPQERRLLEVFARYAAAALDSATALAEATERHRLSNALLELARELASAAGSTEIAERLVAATPHVIDCDLVQVYVWDEPSGKLVRKAYTSSNALEVELGELALDPRRASLLREHIERPSSEPIYIDSANGDPWAARMLAALGSVASVAVPIATREHLLGALIVSVTERPERLAPCPELADRLSGVVAQARSALENGRLLDQITHQARHDALTGLINRGHFGECLQSATADRSAAVRGATVFYLDLDCFKEVNDRLGHEAGDELLCGVARRLLDSVRPGDIVARLGGDEFAVLVHDIGAPEEVEAVASRLAGAFAEPFALAGEQLAVAASIGRASWPADTAEIECLMRRADAAMYAVKRSRKRALSAESTPR
jgi:diguanylate cyclase (GGDEF)-like protein